MPYGFLVTLFSKKNKWWQVLIFGVILSVLLEVIQGLLGIGISDIDDVILNSFGLLVGYGIYKFIYSVLLNKALD